MQYYDSGQSHVVAQRRKHRARGEKNLRFLAIEFNLSAPDNYTLNPIPFTLLFPAHRHEHRTRDENRGINTSRNTDQQYQHEVNEVGRTDKEQGDQNQDKRKRSIDGSREGLVDALVHNLGEFHLATICKEVFANAVEDDDRVVHRKTHDDEQGDKGVRINLNPFHVAEDREKTRRDGNIMEQREQGNPAILP